MEGISVEYFTTSIANGINEVKSELHSYISDDNEQASCDSHSHLFHVLKKNRIRKISVWYFNILVIH